MIENSTSIWNLNQIFLGASNLPVPAYDKEKRDSAYSSLKFYSDYCGAFLRLGIIIYITHLQFDNLSSDSDLGFQYRIFSAVSIIALSMLYGPLTYNITFFNYQSILLVFENLFKYKSNFLSIISLFLSIIISILFTYIIFSAISDFIDKQ